MTKKKLKKKIKKLEKAIKRLKEIIRVGQSNHVSLSYILSSVIATFDRNMTMIQETFEKIAQILTTPSDNKKEDEESGEETDSNTSGN
ncbi:hypothetical protein LCGC14_1239070 [marine sediment metagenome]|uniref:Uncharacterized protein n=1 Tax=marine sediment metagenome TaxID=412755 RepID=A0A0F9LAH2_9ZZZZ